MGEERSRFRLGVAYGLAAYGWWGLMPLYIRALDAVSPWEILAHRIVQSFLLLLVIMTLFGRWSDFIRILRTPRILLALSCSAILVAVNWIIYIYGVTSNQTVETSLGYFTNPLFSVFLGLVFFRERLRPGQWLAISLAASGIGYLLVQVAGPPWIALGIAFSFGLYGLIRKITPVDAVIGLGVETLLLSIPALTYLIFLGFQGTLAFGGKNMTLNTLIVAGGIVTAVPLICFGNAARRLPL
ncbi:MAG: EamA family transporter RarD, partial [Candidatus Acidiferrum sp.]